MCRISICCSTVLDNDSCIVYSIFGESLPLTCEPWSRVNVLLVRGMCRTTPAVRYLCCDGISQADLHWIVGDRLRCFKTGTRNGPLQDFLSFFGLPLSSNASTTSRPVLHASWTNGSPTGIDYAMDCEGARSYAISHDYLDRFQARFGRTSCFFSPGPIPARSFVRILFVSSFPREGN